VITLGLLCFYGGELMSKEKYRVFGRKVKVSAVRRMHTPFNCHPSAVAIVGRAFGSDTTRRQSALVICREKLL
jgi:hypothetical protein